MKSSASLPAGRTQSVPRSSVDPICAAFARILRREREAAGLSRNGLARRCQLTRQAISFIETGRRVPTLDTLARLGRALQRSLSGLLRAAERRH